MIRPSALLRLMRPRQWVKNGFVFAPVFFGNKMLNLELVWANLLTVLVFCLVASSIYVLNDLCDIAADRAHATKRTRPLASGAVTPPQAIGLMVLLLAGSAAVLLLGGLPLSVGAAVVIFFVCNIAYSLWLKHVALLELFIVASGYVIRLLAGGAAIGIALSPWIVTATGLIALMLTTGKRRADIAQENDRDQMRKSLSGYSTAFLDTLLAMFAGATIVVFVIFCASDYASQHYGPHVLLTAVPVALGITRYLQLAMVRNGGDNPTDLVTRDVFILSSLLVFGIIFTVLIYAKNGNLL